MKNKLFKKVNTTICMYSGQVVETPSEQEATLSDIKAALAEFGMVAVPVEPTDRMFAKGMKVAHRHQREVGWTYIAMTQAAQEQSE